MATNIGPRIGITGEAEYRKQIKHIVESTKNLTNEFKALNTAFEKNDTSIKSNKAQREALKKSIEQTEKALQSQKDMLERASAEFNSLGVITIKNKTALESYSANVNNTANELENLKAKLNELPTSLEVVKKAIENNDSAWKRNAEIIKGVGSTMTRYITLPIMAAIGGSVKAATDWESGFTGVKKTVDEVVDDNGNLIFSYEELENQLKNVAGTSVIAYDELLGVAEISGQLGIDPRNVAAFTDIMLKLGASTNLSSEEAATNIARILNITNKGMPTSIDQTERFANVLVDLGNNFATTESEITLMSTRLASAGTVAGLSTDEILALATAMSSVGIRAEAGGSAMAQTLINIEKRVASFSENGGSDLDRIAELSKMSAEDFANAWKTEPAEALSAFIQGLGELDENAESTTLILEELDMDGIRQANMIKALSLAYPQLTNALELANTEWENGSALQDEYNKRAETTESKVQNLKNNLGLLGVELGDTLLPSINTLVEGLTKLVNSLNEMDPSTKKLIVNAGLITAAVGPLLTIGAKLVIMISNLKVALETLKGLNLLKTLGGAGGLGMFAGIAGVIGGLWYLIFNGEEFDKWATEFFQPVKDFGDQAVEYLGTLPEKIWNTLTELGEGIALVFSDLWENVKEDTSTRWNAIVEFFSGVWETLSTSVSNFLEGVSTFFTETWNGIKEFFATTWENMKAKFDDIIGAIALALFVFAMGVVDTFTNIKDSIFTKVGEIYDTVVEGFGKAVTWIKDLVGQAFSWGSDMINGIVNGIKSAWEGLKGAVKSVADGIASFLHFSRPDVGPLRDYETWMPDFMKGLASGIDNNLFRIEDAMKDVSSTMVLNPGEQARANSYNYGGVVINLNVPEGANGRQLVDEIETEIVNRTLRGRAVFGQ